MNDPRAVVADADPSLEALAAELTAAAYSVALRHAVGDKWLELQLELWRALTATVKEWGGACRWACGRASPLTGFATVDVLIPVSPHRFFFVLFVSFVVTNFSRFSRGVVLLLKVRVAPGFLRRHPSRYSLSILSRATVPLAAW